MIKSDSCMTASEYLNYVLDYSDPEVPETESLTFEEFDRIRAKHSDEFSLWDYPLTEIDYIIASNTPVVLVSFQTATPGILEYRFCEVDPEYVD